MAIISYYPLFYLFTITVVLASLLLTINVFLTWVVRKQTKTDDKLSAYECGFEPFESARLQFNVQYYLVGILFLIFDVEVIFLFPWSIVYTILETSSFSVWFFLSLLTLGFIYEWYKGALKW